jgi:trehalose/maltose hydrolase-like predicted phosphorylase
VVHSWVLARSDRSRAWRHFAEALESDIADVQGGTTPEGIHLGAMAGTVDLLQRAYTGLETRADMLGFEPYLPDALSGMRFRLRYRQPLEVQARITHDCLTLGGGAQHYPALPVRVHGRRYRLDPSGNLQVSLQRRRPETT